jgi:hypothetical protein
MALNERSAEESQTRGGGTSGRSLKEWSEGSERINQSKKRSSDWQSVIAGGGVTAPQLIQLEASPRQWRTN